MSPELIKKLQVVTFIIVFMSNSAAHKADENDTAKQLFGEERPFLEDGKNLFDDSPFEDSLGLNKTLDDQKPRESVSIYQPKKRMKAMTKEQEAIVNAEEVTSLIGNLRKHANVLKMTGYFDAAYDVVLACQKLENLSLLLQTQTLEVSQ